MSFHTDFEDLKDDCHEGQPRIVGLRNLKSLAVKITI